MPIQILAKLRPDSTNITHIYSPPAGGRSLIRRIKIVNNSNQARGFSIYFDPFGAEYDEDTAIFFNTTIQIQETLNEEEDSTAGLYELVNGQGSLAVSTSVADDLLFFIFGEEFAI